MIGKATLITTPKIMSELKLTEQLRCRLDEVEFVYHHLPKALERARKSSGDEPWGLFFRDEASALRRQGEALRATVEWWGKRKRPYFSSAVEKHLNEARLVMTDRRVKPAIGRTIHAVLNTLRGSVISGLEEAVRLALRIQEHELAQRLRALLKDERLHQPAPRTARLT